MSSPFSQSLTAVDQLFHSQVERVERIKKAPPPIDYSSLNLITIGLIDGDGIGPCITDVAAKVIKTQLHDQPRIRFRKIDGLTIEARAKARKSIPDDLLAAIKECNVLLKGPTTTPEKGDGWPNLESANITIRKELDLYANVRPVKIPEDGIDWTFFRENTEGLYALGSSGIELTPDIAFDFRVITNQGSERVLKMAFEFAASKRKRLTVVTKANVLKVTDGKFLDVAKRVAQDYPTVKWDSWYVDIMGAKLIDKARQSEFEVLVMPNLYGDILTDEAAQIQGGVGTAGAANIGNRYAMFEAIHGSALRMVAEGRAQYADPSSILRAAAMLVEHIGYAHIATKLNQALDICGRYERKLKITGRSNGASGAKFGEYIIQKMAEPSLGQEWRDYVTKG